MTLWEYKTKCAAAGIVHPFIDPDMMLAYPDLLTTTIVSNLEYLVTIQRETLTLDTEGYEDLDLDALHFLIQRRVSAAFIPSMDGWTVRLKNMTALKGLSVSDLGTNWSRARTTSGQKSGETSTEGTATRNSFNSDTMVPVSGSDVAAESSESYSDTMTETGTNGRSREETIASFLTSIEWSSLLDDMASAIVSAIAITVW